MPSYDPASRTFSAIASSFADVKRTGLFGSFVERLPRSPNAWDLARVSSPAGVSLLAGHEATDPRAAIGRVTSARVTPEGLFVGAALNDSAMAREIEPQVASGDANLSIGYQVGPLVRVGEDADDVPIFEPSRVSLVEVSLVGAAADPGAFIRSYAEGFTMPDPTVETTRQPSDATQIRPADAVAAERARVADITAIGTRAARSSPHVIGQDFVQGFINDGSSVQAFREALLERLVVADETGPQTFSQVHTGPGHDPRRSIEGALALRMGARLSDAEAAPARELLARSGGTLLGIGRAWLDLTTGERPGTQDRVVDSMLRTRALGGLHTTSDFPALLSSAGRRVLLESYQAAASPLLQLARVMDLSDFRAIDLLKLGEAPALLLVNEHGEVTHGTMTSAKEALSLKTYARIIGLTRQAIINDDLGAFSDRMRIIGRGAAETVASTVAALLTANAGLGATLDDGLALFHANHDNMTASGR